MRRMEPQRDAKRLCIVSTYNTFAIKIRPIQQDGSYFYVWMGFEKEGRAQPGKNLKSGIIYGINLAKPFHKRYNLEYIVDMIHFLGCKGDSIHHAKRNLSDLPIREDGIL